jgi:hypothetical protein
MVWSGFTTRSTKAQLLTEPSAKTIGKQIKEGNLLIELRLHDKGTRVRNHGTGFRAYEAELPLLFEKVRDLGKET